MKDLQASNQADRGTPRYLIMTAVEAERQAVLRGLQEDPRFDVQLAGVGPASSGAATAAALAQAEYSLVVSAGIGGGFPGQAPVGTLAIASRIVAADLGVETGEGFASVDELGFGTALLGVDEARAQAWAEAMRAVSLTVAYGPVITVSTATGTQKTAEEHLRRVPGAVAEAMEGYGVAIAALHAELPVLEIRAISNAVGPRDRSAWRMADAFAALTEACRIIKEVTP